MALEASTIALSDRSLLREQAYIGGEWCDANDGERARGEWARRPAAERAAIRILGINTGFVSVEVAPFGGVKESGIGREGSTYGVDDWVQTRYLSLGGIA
jgi:hypothetical protein